MKKIEEKALTIRDELIAIVLKCSPFQIPEVGNCSGSNGKATEVGYKCEMGCYKSASEGVADIGKTDMYKYGIDPETGKRRRYSFEIKTRCGTVGVNSAKGYDWKYDKYDFIVYFINRSDFSKPLWQQCLVIPSAAFKQAMIDNNMYHYHYEKGTADRVPENSIKCNIQTYDNSKKRRAAWENSLNFEGMPWDLFAEIYNIKY